jgi:hypothetical protein
MAFEFVFRIVLTVDNTHLTNLFIQHYVVNQMLQLKFANLNPVVLRIMLL